MDIKGLEVECEKEGESTVKVWANCETPEDIDVIIAWLHLAKSMMKKWRSLTQAE